MRASAITASFLLCSRQLSFASAWNLSTRQIPLRDSLAFMHSHVASVKGDCVVWQGPLFGRLPKSGKECLLQRGWKLVEESPKDDETTEQHQRLAFVWPSKSGPQFEMSASQAAHIRPYPKEVTDVVDDKIRLSQILESRSDIAPKCITTPHEAESDKLYFVKHRHGAQGNSVYVYNKHELEDWWSRSRNPRDFVIQEEIPPALDQGGRKFVLRSHILILQRDSELYSFLHKTVICQHHSTPYHNSREKSSQISQAGKKRHPLPVLLQDLDPQHPAAQVFPQIEWCSKQLVTTFLEATGAQNLYNIARDTTCFALWGTDLLVDNKGHVKICEVNSHPALGWGTMSKVPQKVFSDLIQQVLTLLMDGDLEEQEDTGFLPILLESLRSPKIPNATGLL